MSVSSLASAETRYVTDEFEITLRTGTSTTNSILRMLRSGEAVTVLETDLASKYSLVETADDKKGYVLTRFLMEQPSARESLQKLSDEYSRQSELVSQLQQQVDALNASLTQQQDDNEVLKNTLRSSEQELGEVRSAASDTLQTLEDNNRLKIVVADLREDQTRLNQENAELKDSTRLDWFVRGGAVSLIAFVIGILVTRVRWKKQDSWGSY